MKASSILSFIILLIIVVVSGCARDVENSVEADTAQTLTTITAFTSFLLKTSRLL